MVVDLAVEEDPHAAVLVRHRLHCRVVEVDDREAPVPEADRAVVRDPGPASVGPAMVHRLAHPGDVLLGDTEVATAEGENAGDAAHAERC